MCNFALIKLNDKIKEEKLKIIEIIMILGVIIGSVELEKGHHNINTIFGLFLLGSILYYFFVSYTDNYKGLILASVITATSFSGVVVLPIIDGNSKIYTIFVSSLFIILSILVFIILYFIRKEDIQKVNNFKMEA